MTRISSCLSFVLVFLLVQTSTLFSQQADGDWYTDALARIDSHRKGAVTINIVDSFGNPISGAAIQVDMQRHSFGWGTAVPAGWINGTNSDAQIFRAKVLENFNQVVFENDLKWPPWIGLWGSSFSWNNTRTAMDWCDANNLPIRGHYLSWATWSGADAWGNSDDQSTVQQRLFDHISNKAATVGNRVQEWDVINHPIGWTGTNYGTLFGSQFYADIVDHARASVPVGMELWVNEDNILAGGAVANDYEAFVQQLITDGSPPDGIGFQAHFIQDWGRIRPAEDVYNELDRYSNLIPRLQATEFDIDVGTNESLQSSLMHEYLVAMFSHPDLEAITLWGFWEDSHWMPDAALYRSDWSEKPSLTAYQDLVLGDWWTNESGTSNTAGQFDVDGFLGDYLITVVHEGRTYEVEYALESGSDVIDIVVGGEIIVPDVISPATQFTIIRNGGMAELTNSDNQKLIAQTLVSSKIKVYMKGVSPVAVPNDLTFTFEGATRSSIANVNQLIEMYNYDTDAWEEVDSRPAKILNTNLFDLITIVEPGGDVSRFVKPGTREMEARVAFERTTLTRKLLGYYDQAIWRVYE